jgi:hypothetical protein
MTSVGDVAACGNSRPGAPSVSSSFSSPINKPAATRPLQSLARDRPTTLHLAPGAPEDLAAPAFASDRGIDLPARRGRVKYRIVKPLSKNSSACFRRLPREDRSHGAKRSFAAFCEEKSCR